MKFGSLVVLLVACIGLMVGCGKSDNPEKKSDEVENVVQDMNIPKTSENSDSGDENK